MAKTIQKGVVQIFGTFVNVTDLLIISVQPIFADAIWTRYSNIMKDVYGKIVGISTIVAITAAAVALIVRFQTRFCEGTPASA